MTRIQKARHPNPFYPGAYTVALTDPTSGRLQCFPVWPTTTRREFVRLARHHLAEVRRPYPVHDMPRRLPLRFSRDRGLNGGQWTA